MERRYAIEITEAGKQLNYQVSEQNQRLVIEAVDELLEWGKEYDLQTHTTVQVTDATALSYTKLCHAYFASFIAKPDTPSVDVTSIVVRRFALAEDGKSIKYREADMNEFAGQSLRGEIRPALPNYFHYEEGTVDADVALGLHKQHIDAEYKWFSGQGGSIATIGSFWNGTPEARLGTMYSKPRDVTAQFFPNGKHQNGRPSVYVPRDHVARGLEGSAQITRRGQVIAGHFHPHQAISYREISDELQRTNVPARYFVGIYLKGQADTPFVNLIHEKGVFPNLCSLRRNVRKWQYKR